MKQNIQKLLSDANIAKMQYAYGNITREQANEVLNRFKKEFDLISIREAKKAGVKPRLFNITSFLR